MLIAVENYVCLPFIGCLENGPRAKMMLIVGIVFVYC